MTSCSECGEMLVLVDNYGACPQGHGKLLILGDADRKELSHRVVVQNYKISNGLPGPHRFNDIERALRGATEYMHEKSERLWERGGRRREDLSLDLEDAAKLLLPLWEFYKLHRESVTS